MSVLHTLFVATLQRFCWRCRCSSSCPELFRVGPCKVQRVGKLERVGSHFRHVDFQGSVRRERNMRGLESLQGSCMVSDVLDLDVRLLRIFLPEILDCRLRKMDVRSRARIHHSWVQLSSSLAVKA